MVAPWSTSRLLIQSQWAEPTDSLVLLRACPRLRLSSWQASKLQITVLTWKPCISKNVNFSKAWGDKKKKQPRSMKTKDVHSFYRLIKCEVLSTCILWQCISRCQSDSVFGKKSRWGWEPRLCFMGRRECSFMYKSQKVSVPESPPFEKHSASHPIRKPNNLLRTRSPPDVQYLQ